MLMRGGEGEHKYKKKDDESLSSFLHIKLYIYDPPRPYFEIIETFSQQSKRASTTTLTITVEPNLIDQVAKGLPAF
jgi:hypothetical protein